MKIAKRLIAGFTKMLVKTGVMKDRIILNMDGGICSQIHFYLAGKILESRGQQVIYNLDWYEYDGKDLDGRFCRNFDLLKAFPTLPFKEANNRLAKRLYRIAFRVRNEYFEHGEATWPNLISPKYVTGYFKETDEMFGKLYTDTFRTDRNVLDAPNRRMYDIIETAEKEGGACAIHVRRGDLARHLEAYGSPVTADYFTWSCRRVAEANPDVRFFLFSDEPEWCRNELMPSLSGYEVEVCDINGSDKGWCDLILMSRCRHHICSQGSMGKYAALLRPEERREGIVTIPDNEFAVFWRSKFKTCIVKNGCLAKKN